MGYGERMALRERCLGVGFTGKIGIWENGFWCRGDFWGFGEGWGVGEEVCSPPIFFFFLKVCSRQ